MSHLTFEELCDYWAGEGETQRLDEHLMGCERCTALSASVAGIAATLRTEIDSMVTRADVERLRARGLRIVEEPVAAGERREIVFPHGVDILLFRLAADLAGATRVDVTLIEESTGARLVEHEDVRFDRGGDAVLIACQRHFASFPRDIAFEVRTHGPAPAVHTYTVIHRFA